MIRKTMRIGEVRTSIKLEKEFWSYLKEVADERQPAPVGAGQRGRRRHARAHQPRLDPADLRPDPRAAAQSDDAARARPSVPGRQHPGSGQGARGLPAAVPRARRRARRSASSTAPSRCWLNLDPRATVGQRLDNIMILRGQSLKEMWAGLGDGRLIARGLQRHLRLARQGAHLAGHGRGAERRPTAGRPRPARLRGHVRDAGRP